MDLLAETTLCNAGVEARCAYIVVSGHVNAARRATVPTGSMSNCLDNHPRLLLAPAGLPIPDISYIRQPSADLRQGISTRSRASS